MAYVTCACTSDVSSGLSVEVSFLQLDVNRSVHTIAELNRADVHLYSKISNTNEILELAKRLARRR